MRKTTLHNIQTLLFFSFAILSFSKAQKTEFSIDKQYLFERPSKISNLRSSYIENAGTGDWNLTYNRLEIKVDPNVNWIEGKVLFEFTSLVDSLKSIRIDLDNSLTVSAVLSLEARCPFLHENGYVQIQLPQTLNRNQSGSFTVSYDGIPNSSGFGAFTQNLHEGIPAIYTLSEPYGAKEWWPCKESLSDKIDSIDVLVETPAQFRTASNGLLISDSVFDQKRICHWKHRHPIANYLVFFSSTIYEVYADSITFTDGTKMEILNYVYPESLEVAKQITPFTVDYLNFFSRKFMDYPFKNEKYGHAQFGWGGGMEHQTMTSLGAYSKDLIAHELAHQWFGDYKTCASWKELWLNEGFATYLEALTLERFDVASWDAWKASVLLYITSKPDGSVYIQDTTDINRLFDGRLTYYKGGYVLHMLRGQIGDSAFFKGMKGYLNDPRTQNGFTTTDIFRENMEQAADTSLIEFFNDWIYGEGHPIYDIKWSYTNNQLDLIVFQKPSSTNGPFYEMKLPITIVSNNMEGTFWFSNTEQGQHFSIYVPFHPLSVTFNEDKWILAKEEDFNNTLITPQSAEIIVLYHADERQLTVRVPLVDKASYSILDFQGRVLKYGVWNRNNPVIDLNGLTPGVYMLNVATPQKNYTSKFRMN